MAYCVCYDKNYKDYLRLSKCIKTVNNNCKVMYFDKILHLITYVTNNSVEVIFLSVDMDEISLNELIKTLLKINNGLKIILVSTKKEDAYEAVKNNMTDFLLKPATVAEVKRISGKICGGTSKMIGSVYNGGREVRVTTMPIFEMFIDGQRVQFKGAKMRELMAYMVDADGGVVTTEMIVESLWDDEIVGISQRNRCAVLVNGLKRFLKEKGLNDLFVAGRGRYHLNKAAYTCDLDDVVAYDPHAILRYDHRYMEEYSWGERRKGLIEKIIFGHKE